MPKLTANGKFYGRPATNSRRDRDIYIKKTTKTDSKPKGYSYRELSEEYGLARSRITQIVYDQRKLLAPKDD